MLSDRQSFRMRQQFDIFWSIPGQKIEGQGRIYNISLSGMLFVTDRLFDPAHALEMCFSVPEIPSFPSKGKLVWFRKVGQGRSQYQGGVKFSDEKSHNPLWIKWMEENILKLADVQDSKVLDRILTDGQEKED